MCVRECECVYRCVFAGVYIAVIRYDKKSMLQKCQMSFLIVLYYQITDDENIYLYRIVFNADMESFRFLRALSH